MNELIKKIIKSSILLGLTLNFTHCDHTNSDRMTPPESYKKVSMESEVSELKITNQVDILFIIDNSESMLSHQRNLASNIKYFVHALEDSNLIDYHIGITTIFDKRYGKEIKKFNPLGHLIPLKREIANLPFNFYTRDHHDLDLLSDSLMIGVVPLKDVEGNYQGPEVEQIFSPIEKAFAEPAISSLSNLGFYRPDAKLVIIIITDADDSSVGLSGSDLNQKLRALKNNPDGSMLSYFGLLANKEDCEKVDPGMTTPYPVQIHEFINSNLGSIFSLCKEKEFDQMLSTIGVQINNSAQSQYFPLKGIPEFGTLKVFLGEEELKYGPRTWGYDPVYNQIIVKASPRASTPEARKIRFEYTTVNMENVKNGRARGMN